MGLYPSVKYIIVIIDSWLRPILSELLQRFNLIKFYLYSEHDYKAVLQKYTNYLLKFSKFIPNDRVPRLIFTGDASSKQKCASGRSREQSPDHWCVRRSMCSSTERREEGREKEVGEERTQCIRYCLIM